MMDPQDAEMIKELVTKAMVALDRKKFVDAFGYLAEIRDLSHKSLELHKAEADEYARQEQEEILKREMREDDVPF